MMYGRQYSQGEKEFFSKYSFGHSHKEIAEEFNRRFSPKIKVSQVKSYLGNNKITTGRTGQFKKGHTTYNKGVKRGSFGRMTETQFKKGNIPPQHRPVGSERYDSRDDTLYIKIAEPNIWKSKQTIVWEKYNGPITDGHVIIFLDGDKSNYKIDNLDTVDRATNLALNRNNLRTKDRDLTKTGVATAKLIREIQKKR